MSSSSSSSALQWLSLVGIIWLQSINGTNTDFPAYSTQLKNLLSLSQLQLNNLAFASDAGKLMGWLSGIASYYLPLWLVLLIGSFLGLIGYGVQFLFLTNQISSFSYPQIFLMTVLAGNSICWINTVCYIVAIRNFPFDRQVVVGLTTSYIGLSAKLYTNIVDALLPSNNSPAKRAKTYLLLNSILPLLVSFVVSPMFKTIDVAKMEVKKTGFIIVFIITIGTGIYAVVTSLGFLSSGSSSSANAIGLGIFLLAPLAMPISVWFNREPKVHVVNVEDNKDIINIEIMELAKVCDEEIGNFVREEIGVKEMVKRIDFWLYFFVYFFGATIGLVFLNNLGQIAESRGCTNVSSLVSLSSSFGFFGRMLPSLLDYFFSRNKYMISNPALILASMAPMAASFFLLLNASNFYLHVCTGIIGFCTGVITTVSVSTTTELFGTKKFGVNHNIVVANIPLGSFLFGYAAAVIYRKEGDGLGKCMGMACYKKTLIIWGSLCFIGVFFAFSLYVRTRNFYSTKLCNKTSQDKPSDTLENI
ncbi:hypothetical protein ACFE04_004791 [Oxalis oulophora]